MKSYLLILKKVGDELIKPTKIYIDYILPLIKKNDQINCSYYWWRDI